MNVEEKPKSKKIMLWISVELLNKIDLVKPKEFSTQEAIRQILEQTLEGVKDDTGQPTKAND